MAAYIRELRRIFRASPTKEQAHARSQPLLLDMASDSRLMTVALRRRISSPGGLTSGHYPVIALDIASDPDFHLVLNCWLPSPDSATDISTKAIHHHGTMLLTTVTTFGSGYEHWTFEHPTPVDPDRDLFTTQVLEHGQHGLGDLAYVDAYVAHVPLFPATTTATLALWSSRDRTTWRDHLKRIAILEKRAVQLRRVGTRLGLARALALKNVEYFDFYPASNGFIGVRERVEFPLGPTTDYLASLFHLLQVTGNEGLGADIDAVLSTSAAAPIRPTTDTLLNQLRLGEPIQPRLSDGHYGVMGANFRRSEIVQALSEPIARNVHSAGSSSEPRSAPASGRTGEG